MRMRDKDNEADHACEIILRYQCPLPASIYSSRFSAERIPLKLEFWSLIHEANISSKESILFTILQPEMMIRICPRLFVIKFFSVLSRTPIPSMFFLIILLFEISSIIYFLKLPIMQLARFPSLGLGGRRPPYFGLASGSTHLASPLARCIFRPRPPVGSSMPRCQGRPPK